MIAVERLDGFALHPLAGLEFRGRVANLEGNGGAFRVRRGDWVGGAGKGDWGNSRQQGKGKLGESGAHESYPKCIIQFRFILAKFRHKIRQRNTTYYARSDCGPLVIVSMAILSRSKKIRGYANANCGSCLAPLRLAQVCGLAACSAARARAVAARVVKQAAGTFRFIKLNVTATRWRSERFPLVIT
jgi:hypothetical protein